jgi:hypothetical protein
VITLPRRTSDTICCHECRQRVGFLPTGFPVLHHFPDGTQCPDVWPAYVVGFPRPTRRAAVTHNNAGRRRRRR